MRDNTNETAPRNEIVVVTGASRGIGAATARELARRGYHVLAGVRSDDDVRALKDSNLEPVLLDITDEAEIAALVRRVMDFPAGRRLRALVNNAGLAINTPLETYTLTEWRRLFEVNLFGHVAMTQALLPALIAGRGTVVNMSSVGGKVAMATYGPYAASKFALEAASDALRREVASLGVKVVVIEPGAVTTSMLGEVDDRGRRVLDAMTPAQRGRYAALMHAVVRQARPSASSGAPPEEAGRVIADAIASERPRARYTVGRSTAMIVRLTRLLSDRMLDRLLARNLKPYIDEYSSDQ
ncbi:SDR family oxidoreductase [Sphingomonas sp.]|uniref:SDR family oxidoreductase n=1 Tax=Sphingomonas sp. TaxID=28214 RepID=UPI003B00A582